MKIKNKYIYISIAIIVLCFGIAYAYKKYAKLKLYREESALQAESNSADDANFEHDLKEAAKISPDVWDKKYQDMKTKKSYRVVFITNRGGEYSYAKYFKYAAEKIGWQVRIYEENIYGYEKEILKFDPDFILLTMYTRAFLGTELTNHRSKKYATLLLSIKSLRNQLGMMSKQSVYETQSYLNEHMLSSDAVITTAKEVDIFKIIFNKLNKPFNGIRVLPLIPRVENKPAEPKSLIWGGVGWDKFRSSDNYKRFISLLGENVPIKIYGSYKTFSYLPKGVYDGNIPPGMDNIEAIRKNGIYLLTHSETHIETGTPSLRIFEATAANAVVISDMHPFAIENFGDNFLYFDQNADAETMYKQVKAHMDWIKSNPEKAKAMADRAHKIFLEKFTLDKDLNRIAKMHEYILKEEKEMNLSYPIAY